MLESSQLRTKRLNHHHCNQVKKAPHASECKYIGAQTWLGRLMATPPQVRVDLVTRRLRGLPVLVHGVSRRAWGLRLRRTGPELALSFLTMLPSADDSVGVTIAIFSKLDTQPIYSPVYSSVVASQRPLQKLGAGWIATPPLS